ncbi:hypothetical protein DVK05_00055 [Halorubrum sp. Atlit-8R]|uniref:hypothetical protein n=1 Tax=unclassified Halorubrum TaxID=2642239 RepID=UPI000EF1D46B|nr:MULTISPECIES: hypothetical protein [unclassified Halorubrum]RLM72211.1 hypothetical protein DVK08_08910 [Halorubrum sp. Atlit-9R]RLM82236.1 hypothetical protein DVK05_00055 [Halorubrum sp. Atlit-8R]
MTAPTFDLETNVTRDRPVTQQEGSIQVGQDELNESVITLSFGGPWGTTYADLTPEEARAVATALEDTATQATQQEENVDE